MTLVQVQAQIANTVLWNNDTLFGDAIYFYNAHTLDLGIHYSDVSGGQDSIFDACNTHGAFSISRSRGC